MVCKTLFALCIFTAGLRVHSLPTSASLPVSLPAKVTPPLTIWTSSPQNTSAVSDSQASDIPSTSGLPIAVLAPTSTLPKNNSTETREGAVTNTATKWEATTQDSSPGRISPTSSRDHSTPVSGRPGSATPEIPVPATESQTSTQSSTSISPQTPVSSPQTPVSSPQTPVSSPQTPVSSPQTPVSSPPATSASPPETPPASVILEHNSTVSTPQPSGTPTTPAFPTEEGSSAIPSTAQPTTEPMPKEGTPQETESGMVMCEFETTTPFVIMREVEHALSSGSIAAITVTVIAVVLLVFGVAAYLKIRHSSYGRLLDDHDYGSWGNYNNPLYDDS
ncbi:prostate androgen-regulated mucin-like protein 1 [Ochotona princeps]|uniref:prostate androgen-regulated mucin-like protein 1 n=1 Tax=Ochotona princeps TaxID=9978 RepID=UPI0027151E6C|nr:prostate androgen-regulated mucin-like protein 1 [Ochotona princeps]